MPDLKGSAAALVTGEMETSRARRVGLRSRDCANCSIALFVYGLTAGVSERGEDECEEKEL